MSWGVALTIGLVGFGLGLATQPVIDWLADRYFWR